MEKHAFLFGILYSVHTFYKVLADFDNIGTGHMKNALHARGSVLYIDWNPDQLFQTE
jgi:hypothetical protein